MSEWLADLAPRAIAFDGIAGIALGIVFWTGLLLERRRWLLRARYGGPIYAGGTWWQIRPVESLNDRSP